jgi:hypothetical protein
MTKAINKSSPSINAVSSLKPVGVGLSVIPLSAKKIEFENKMAAAIRNLETPFADRLYQAMEVLEEGRIKAQLLWNELEGALWSNDDLMATITQDKLNLAESRKRFSLAELNEYIMAEYEVEGPIDGVAYLLKFAGGFVTCESLLAEQLLANLSTMLEMSDTLLTLSSLRIAMEEASA